VSHFRSRLRRFAPVWLTAIRTHRKHHGTLPKIFFPKTFNEKICHRKIFDRRDILALFTDKYAVRDYVAQILGPGILPRLFHVTRDPASIPFDALPEKFVVKPTHGCGWVHLVKDKSRLDRAALIATCDGWLRGSYYELTREWQYKNITPRILIEEFIDDGSGEAPVDYKFMVFHGKVRVIHAHTGRFTDHKVAYYDRNWQKLNVLGIVDGVRPVTEDVPRPTRLDDMIAVAEALGADMDFVRVDLYAARDRIYFGELTITPTNGVIRYEPVEFDLYLGRLWNQMTG
jgi:teichuronopeptide biosynthesis TupA-like protein